MQTPRSFPRFTVRPDSCGALAPYLDTNAALTNGWNSVHAGGDGRGSNVWVFSYGTQQSEEAIPQLTIALGGNDRGVSKGVAIYTAADGSAPRVEAFTLDANGLNDAVAKFATVAPARSHTRRREPADA